MHVKMLATRTSRNEQNSRGGYLIRKSTIANHSPGGENDLPGRSMTSMERVENLENCWTDGSRAVANMDPEGWLVPLSIYPVVNHENAQASLAR